MVRLCKHTPAPSLVIVGYLGSGSFQDTWSRVDSLPKQLNVNDLMAQSVEVFNCLSCPLYHVYYVFCCLLPIVLGYKMCMEN